MLLESASHEISLLLFSILVPVGITTTGLVALAASFNHQAEQAISKKLSLALICPVILIVAGLIAAVTHVGSPVHIFGMANKTGVSPLSNEIVVAGLGSVIAIAYWIFLLVKKPVASTQRAFGVIVTACGLIVALFTGLAYMIETVPTWNTPFAWIGQICSTCAGSAILAATLCLLAGEKESPISSRILVVIGVLGATGMIINVFAQGSFASGVISSASITLASAIGDYQLFAGWATFLAVIGIILWVIALKKKLSPTTLMSISCLAVFVAMVLIRIDFYGIFLTAGL